MNNKVLLALLGAIVAAGLFVGYFATVPNAPCGSGECKLEMAASPVYNNTSASGQNDAAGERPNSTPPEIWNNTAPAEVISGSGAAGEETDGNQAVVQEEIKSQINETNKPPAANGSAWNGTGVKLGKVEDLQISASTDNNTYYSHEQMNLTVNMSIGGMLPGFLKAQGIKNKFGAYKFKKSDRVNLAAGENSYSWIYWIPACYSCSGITPGNYSIDAWFENASGNKSDVVTVAIKIKSEDEG